MTEREEGREHLVQPEPEVLEGEDDIPRQPAPPLDPYTPEPAFRPGEARAFRVMGITAIVLVAVFILILWAAIK